MNFLNYQFKKFFRSYTFIPPYITHIIWICIFYNYSNQNILSSYAASAIILFFISSWITFIIFDLEGNNEKHLLFIQLNSKIKFLYLKIFFSFISSIPLIIISFLFPIVTYRFSEAITFRYAFLSIYLHIIVVILGVILGSLIRIQTILSRKYSWLLLVLLTLLSIIKFILVNNQHILKYVLIIVPSVGEFLNYFNQPIAKLWCFDFLILNTNIAVYIVITLILINLIFKYSENH